MPSSPDNDADGAAYVTTCRYAIISRLMLLLMDAAADACLMLPLLSLL